MLYFQFNSLYNNIISSQYNIEIQEIECPLYLPHPHLLQRGGALYTEFGWESEGFV